MHGIVYLNAEGRSVSPLYTWQDGRGNICDDKTGKSLLKEIEEKCQYKAASGYGLITHLPLPCIIRLMNYYFFTEEGV